jgi:hypothetical protein
LPWRDPYSTELLPNDPRSFYTGFFAPDNLYLHAQVGTFLHARFGAYAIYYIGNYLFAIPADVTAVIRALFAPIPPALVTVGVHVRTHFLSLAAFMTHIDRGCNLIADFIQSQ